jgi:hypothetical protein
MLSSPDDTPRVTVDQQNGETGVAHPVMYFCAHRAPQIYTVYF